MKKQTEFSLNIGLPTILLIFVVLCLISFGILSLVSANADWKLSQRLISRSTAYYQACNEAESFLAELDRSLYSLYMQSADSLVYQNATNSLSTVYIFPVSDLQELEIRLSYQTPTKHNPTFYNIESWKLISTDSITYDSGLHVIP